MREHREEPGKGTWGAGKEELGGAWEGGAWEKGFAKFLLIDELLRLESAGLFLGFFWLLLCVVGLLLGFVFASFGLLLACSGLLLAYSWLLLGFVLAFPGLLLTWL